MRQRMIGVFLLSMVLGCTYAGQQELKEYWYDPKTWIKDPHFANYKQKRDELEEQYLQKNITYAEYLEKRTGLDEEYAREVEERNAIIRGE